MPSLPPAIELAVHRRGEGPLLVALHDLGQTGSSMIDALAAVSGEFEIVAPDLRGHGASPTPHGPWSVDDFASDVARLVAAEGGDALLVGVGLGAATGLALALGHPGLISGLVVSGVGPRGEDPEGQDRWARAARALRERAGAEGAALAAEAMGTRPDWRGALAQVDAPVIVVAGAADRAVPAEVQRELSAWMQNARFHVVREAGHNVAVERPNELVQAIRRLSRSLDREPVAA
ncbi:alpha/beta fold hydrolase [Miltoncostaea marina]|uniref:alpha/beta fold hydrolase n=1 Tax=Miltoncostaea marina TaxID=2843215 RepID=UPI001C3D7FC7|nr:alpha/beta hydrolase [Miltoncostaea marina]